MKAALGRSLRVKVQRLDHARGLPLPAYQSDDAAGLDLVAAVAEDAPVILMPGAFAMIPTGLALELPRGTEAQVRPRSGLAARFGVTVLNSPGTIDADYRGEVCVLLVNHSKSAFQIKRGERIAQMVLAPVSRVAFVEVEVLSATKRGAGGFGSTGVAATRSSKQAKSKKAIAQSAPKKKRTSAHRPSKRKRATARS